MKITPQATVVLDHLTRAGSITGVEAEQCHRVRHLPSRIMELRRHGHEIVAETRHDITGQRYARYSLAPA